MRKLLAVATLPLILVGMAPRMAAASSTSRTVHLLTLNDMPIGWSVFDANTGPGTPFMDPHAHVTLPMGTFTGLAWFGENDDVLNVSEWLYKFPSAELARVAANKALRLFVAYYSYEGSALISGVAPMSFPGIKADQFFAYSGQSDGRDDIFIVRDGAKVALLNCWSTNLRVELEVLLEATR